MEPFLFSGTLKVMSIGLLLENQPQAMIWKSPAKHGVIKQLIGSVTWGELKCRIEV